MGTTDIAGTRFAFLHGSNDLYGASRVLLDDVRLLTSQGAHVVVAVPDDGPLTERLRNIGATVLIEPLRVLRRVSGGLSALPAGRLPGCVRQANVVVLWTLALLPYLPLLRMRGKTTICSVHEILEGGAGSSLAFVASLLCPSLMVNSRATAEWLQRHSRRKVAVEVAYPVAPRFEPLDPPSASSPLKLLLAGRINGHKGHLEAARVVRRLRSRGADVELVLAGGSYPGQEAHLEALKNEIRGVDGVQYVGEVSDIRRLLAGVHAVLVPTTRPEPFGIVALEAWSAGRRVIASDEGGLAEAARLVGGVLIEPRSEESLEEAIVRLAADEDARQSIGRGGEVPNVCSEEARLRSWYQLLEASR